MNTGNISRRASWVLVTFLFAGCGDDDAPPVDGGLVDTGADSAMLDSGTLADTSVDTGTPPSGPEARTR